MFTTALSSLRKSPASFPESVRWPNHGLPPARYVLLAGDLKAFTDEGDEVVSHGGIALEEVMVPFVAITRERHMRKVVGIDRKIKRAWVDAVLDRLTQTTDEAELRTFLDKHLKDELPGKESRAKTTGIILRIWSGIPAVSGRLCGTGPWRCCPASPARSESGCIGE